MLPFSLLANVFVFSDLTSVVNLGRCCQWIRSCAYSNHRLILKIQFCFSSTITKTNLRSSFKGCLEEGRYEAFIKKDLQEYIVKDKMIRLVQGPSFKNAIPLPHVFPPRQTMQVAHFNHCWHVYTSTCLLQINTDSNSFPAYAMQRRYPFLQTPHFLVQFDEHGHQLNLIKDSSSVPLPIKIRSEQVRAMTYYGSSLVGIAALNEVHVIDVDTMEPMRIRSPIMLGGMHFLNEKEIILLPASINESARSFADIEHTKPHHRSAVEVLTVWDLKQNACSKRFLLPTREDFFFSNLDSFKILRHDRFIITAAFDSTTGVKLRIIVWDISSPSTPLINQTIKLPQYSLKNVSINSISCLKIHQGMLWLGMNCTLSSIYHSDPKQSAGMLWRFKASDLYTNSSLTEVSQDTLFSTLKASLVHDIGMALVNDQLVTAHVEGETTIFTFYDL
jgi:hypothetical protein